MGIPRYRTKNNQENKIGQYIGQNFVYTQSCPNIQYMSLGNFGYPVTHVDGESVQCWDETHQGPPYKEGGPFFLIRTTAAFSDSPSNEFCARAYKYNGSLTLNIGNSEIVAIQNGYAPTASTYGAAGFNKFRPVKPKVDGGQWIGELRDLPQNPWPWSVTNLQKGILRFKNLGSQFLNYEFGWKPFVKDLVKMFETSRRMENHLKYIKNHNNKWVTRGGIIKNEQNVERTTIGHQSYPSLVSYFYSSTSWPCNKTVITRDTVWFKARMKYYIEGLSSNQVVKPVETIWNSRLVRHLYGLSLTPSLAWELIPFTWLEDWICNVGDVISNFSNSLFDNLVTKYAYVMRHRSTDIIYDETVPIQVSSPVCVGSSFGPYQPRPQNLRVVFHTECKERAGTSQYCFGGGGLLNESLTPRQERILWALGVSRI